MSRDRESKKPVLRVLVASDEDEKNIRDAKPDKTMPFTMPKGSRVGEPVLIFTHKELIARGKIRVKPQPGSEFGSRPVWGGRVGNFELLKPAISMDEVRAAMPEDWLWWKHPRRSFCTPSDENAKELMALVDPALGTKNHNAVHEPQDDEREPSSNGGIDVEADPVERKAVELHAMKLADKYYRDEGFTVEDTSKTHSFDLRCTRNGREVRVEVKGTTKDGSKVELTIGEVNNARGTDWRTDLFVVSEIKVTRKNGKPEGTGGKCRRATAWSPADEDLAATRYQYTIPKGLLRDVTGKRQTTKKAAPKSKNGRGKSP